jgi:hypothetical protein
MTPHAGRVARPEGEDMERTLERTRAELRAMRDAPRLLGQLDRMSVDQLANKYLELYGEPTRSRNGGYLRKRLAWRIQEAAYGGLSPSALERIKQLGDALPESWRMRSANITTPAKPSRDPRLPPAGTILKREYGGAQHEVRVLHDGFEYAGRRFDTLSAVAQEITKTRWNGFAFFQLTKRGGAPSTKESS